MIYLLMILIGGLILYAVVESGSRKKTKVGKTHSLQPGKSGHIDQADIRLRWSTIMATSTTGASGLKSSINEADKLLDHVLKQSGYPGNTMGDRLKLAGKRFSDTNSIWRAHKLRNALAHEVGFDLVPSQAKEALKDFEAGLKDLGALK